MQYLTKNENLTTTNIKDKKPEDLINLIDNILNYVNTQKEYANNQDESFDEDDSGEYNTLFGKFYYDLNKTIFKKIGLEEEYNFMLNNLTGKVFYFLIKIHKY